MWYTIIVYIALQKEVILINKAGQYIAKIIFKNRIFQFKGQQFEDFFVSVMTKADLNFQAVKAHGNIGDRKNDGFDRTTGTYYQVFAPEDITKSKTINDGVKKLEEDFKGLYDNWNNICPIKKFFFVTNDKYNGVPAPIHEMALSLNNDENYSDININVFSAKNLEAIFDSLGESEKQDILGFIPEEIIPVVEYEALHETVSYLLKIELSVDYLDKLVVPDFNEKIIFNNLNPIVNNQLVMGSYQEGLLLHYFNETPGIKEVLQKKFHALYEKSKEDIQESKENFSDCRFYYILEKACPKSTIPIQTSVLVLMAYYFSSCDIFEEPQK
ncbi:MAG: hypothetical protein RR063_11150 [Anaerovoracaceae bacterium]